VRGGEPQLNGPDGMVFEFHWASPAEFNGVNREQGAEGGEPVYALQATPGKHVYALQATPGKHVYALQATPGKHVYALQATPGKR